MTRRCGRWARATRSWPATLAAFATLSIASPVPAGTPVDLELVLAVDASSSVDDGEFALQMRGLAAAFRHPGVHAAIHNVGDDGVAVALIQWSDHAWQTLAVEWALTRDSISARALADEIDAAGRLVPGGGTAIYGVVNAALHELDRNRFDGRRRVIDISGDGTSDLLVPTTAARNRAVNRGIVINGLAILNDEPMLDKYYRLFVIGGEGAFVMTASDYDAFAEAIAAKLIREIASTPVADARPPASSESPRLTALTTGVSRPHAAKLPKKMLPTGDRARITRRRRPG